MTDGPALIESGLTEKEVRAKIKTLALSPSDYALFKGCVLKGFENSKVTWTKLS